MQNVKKRIGQKCSADACHSVFLVKEIVGLFRVINICAVSYMETG